VRCEGKEAFKYLRKRGFRKKKAEEFGRFEVKRGRSGLHTIPLPAKKKGNREKSYQQGVNRRRMKTKGGSDRIFVNKKEERRTTLFLKGGRVSV